jgi:bacterioferritin
MREKVIEMLNTARARELHAISQYMVQHYELEDADFGKLAGKVKEIGIAEMKHAEKLAERILFLGGSPTTKPDAEAKKGLEIAEMLKVDIELEQAAVDMYNDFANKCANEGDNVSKAIFEELLADEEGHVDDFQNILRHVEKLGGAYLATLTG